MRKLGRLLLSSLVATVLAGCAAAPSQDEVEQDVDQAADQQVPDVPQKWAMAADSGTVQTGWIESFDDADLTALVIEAQSNNRDLAAAAANVDRAQALARQAGAALVPDVSNPCASGARTGVADSSGPTTSNLSLGAQVSWEADVWGRVRSQQRGAVASAEADEGVRLAFKYHCTTCHGQTGIASSDRYPNLAGQPTAYLVSRLKYFREGVERGNQMNGQAAPLSDEEIEKLAAYFNSPN